MSEILKKWLSSRLGIVIDYNLVTFENIAQDGTLIAQILYNYGIITQDKLNELEKTYDLDKALKNLSHLRIWLKTLGINLTEQNMHDIVNREKLAAVQVFYQLYVLLNSKSKINYFTETKPLEEPRLPQPTAKLYNACEINEIATSRDINDIKEMLKWHKNKYLELFNRCTTVREEYAKMLENKIKTKVQKKFKDAEPTRDEYQTLTACKHSKKKEIEIIKKPDISVEIDKYGCCKQNISKAKKYINYLKQKHEKCCSKKTMQQQMNKLILLEVLNHLIDTEDAEFKELISSKLLKQSYYEKQMTTKLIEIRHQKQLMLEHLRHENSLILKKKDHEFLDKLLQQDVNLTAKEKQFIDNYQRQQELHKRLWAQKREKEYKENFEMCKTIVNNLLDLAIKFVDYRDNFGKEVSKCTWNEWMALFRTEQPIFDVVQDSMALVQTDDFDEDLTMESYRQDGLDECDFNDYHNVYGIWDLEAALQFLNDNRYVIECGGNILGHIVHRLLLLKYPKPDQPAVHIFPQFDIRAVLIGILNPEILSLLQQTLLNKDILIIEMENIINNCLQVYLTETTIEVDTNLDQPGKKKKKEKKAKPKKKKQKKGSKKSEAEGKPAPIELVPKETQTPRIFPCEELKLSKTAELGKYVYETLNTGLQINENLITEVLADYLKNLKDIRGWILINFPETLNEAYFLEEVYNGKEIPQCFIGKSKSKKKISDSLVGETFTDRDEIFVLPFDEYSDIRLSKLVKKPKPPLVNMYESFFTSFTFMSHIKKSLKVEVDHDIDSPIVKHPTGSASSLIEFYKKLSIANELFYDVVNFETIKDLVKLATRDEILAIQIYNELVELATSPRKQETLEIEPKGKGKKGKGKGKGKEKGGKKGGKEKGKGKGSKKKGSSKTTDKSDEPKEKVKVEKKEEEIDIPPVIRPGEEAWQYIDLPLEKELARILGASWQDIEYIYINDFKEIFFLKRAAQNQIIPYVHEVDTNMHSFIERPDAKQEYLHEFQTTFNEIQNDLREDDEYKAELHFRVQEFRDKLWNLCDFKMKESEEERQRIIDDNWFDYHTASAVNIYVKAAQLEMDRCVETLQLLQDYYTSMILHKPLEGKFPKQTLHKMPTNLISKGHVNEKLKAALTDINNTTEDNTFVKFINTALNTANTYVNSLRNTANSSMKSAENTFTNRLFAKSKKKKAVTTLTEEDIIINKNLNDTLQEWQCAIEGELLRTLFRIKLIRQQAIVNVNENLLYAEELFHNIYNYIQERYNDEVESVDIVCQIFSRAIEACEPIQLRLILDGAKFYIDQNKLFYPDRAFIYGEVREHPTDFEFTIAQLNLLASTFIDLAPSAFMTKKAFTYILEDMVVINCKDCYVSPLPHHWHYLKTFQVTQLVTDLYENENYVNWKDFIIWNMLLSYPTELELLDARSQFRRMDPDKLEFVNEQQFSTVHLWFEDEFVDEAGSLRIGLIKELLCKLFRTRKDNINYTGLLLYFCKDEEPMQGFIKALELAIGTLVCWDVSIGEKFVLILRQQKAIEDAARKDALSAAESALDKIYDKTVAECISTFSFLEEESEKEESEKVPEEHHFILEEEDLGEEEMGEGLPSLCYFLNLSVLMKVITAAYHEESLLSCYEGRSLRQRIEDIYKSLRNEEFDNKVFMHEFLNNEEFTDIINRSTKFAALYPSELVKSLVQICICK